MGDQQWYLFSLIPYIIMVESSLSAIATLFNTLASYLDTVLQNMMLYTMGSLGLPYSAMLLPSYCTSWTAIAKLVI